MIHAKIIVVDGQQGIVSSANLDGCSMGWDTETGVTLDADAATALFERCCEHWFRGAVPAAPGIAMAALRAEKRRYPAA